MSISRPPAGAGADGAGADAPRSTHASAFTLFGVPIKCHQLDTGERIIEADSMERLLEAISRCDSTDADVAELQRFGEWLGGGG